jgi:dTDP-4-dehydrorhamnose 3,5-epimerase
MEFHALSLPGAYEIRTHPHVDERGAFARTYDEELFSAQGLHRAWVQDNQSISTRQGVIRGLHFQRPPHAETKLVRVVRGRVWDVIVDLRGRSATYGRWAAVTLSAEAGNMLYVPRGFAHGFCTLTEEAWVLYKVDARYTPAEEGGLRWDDPQLGIPWPEKSPLLSAKDQALPGWVGFQTPFPGPLDEER